MGRSQVALNELRFSSAMRRHCLAGYVVAVGLAGFAVVAGPALAAPVLSASAAVLTGRIAGPYCA
jgi:hypothetical protein